MSLALYSDANKHLDENKIKFENAYEAGEIASIVDQYIRGKLVEVFGIQVSDWDANPQSGQVATPELVRLIAGLLMASELYSQKYAEEVLSQNTYGARLAKQANDLLDGLRSGELTLIEVNIVSGLTFSQDDFWPNDTTGVADGDHVPKFSMEDVF